MERGEKSYRSSVSRVEGVDQKYQVSKEAYYHCIKYLSQPIKFQDFYQRRDKQCHIGLCVNIIFFQDHIYFRFTPLSVYITNIILPLIETLKFDWLRQILYATILCFLTDLIFFIYPLHGTYRPHITFLNPFHVTLCVILHYDVIQH